MKQRVFLLEAYDRADNESKMFTFTSAEKLVTFLMSEEWEKVKYRISRLYDSTGGFDIPKTDRPADLARWLKKGFAITGTTKFSQEGFRAYPITLNPAGQL